MKFIPILFSTPMVQAINEGRKTMTRRVIKEGSTASDWLKSGLTPNFIAHEGNSRICPYGRVGDILWVRETFCVNTIPTGWPYHYKAANDTFTDPENEKWKPSLFMPKAACRTFLEITNIRVERLQEISSLDAEAEGVKIEDDGMLCWNYLKERYEDIVPEQSFKTLWQSINGPDSWDTNPWVWVISFKRIEKPENFN